MKNQDLVSADLISFEDACTKALVEFTERKEEKPDDTIYHYTSIEALHGILRTRSLWMSDYEFFEDTNEINYAMQQIKGIIIGCVAQQSDSEFWQIFLKKFFRIKDIYRIYICSYCLKVDHLYAWENYAEGSKGVSIGFSKDSFVPQSSISVNEMIVGQKVHYCPDDLKGYINRIISMAIQQLRVSSSDAERKEVGCVMVANFLSLLPKLKEYSWCQENEYRTHRCEYKQNRFISHSEFNRMQIDPSEKFIRSENNKNIPTALYKFDRKDLIEIWLGKNCAIDEVSVKRLLEHFNFMNVKIIKSSI
jgi:hypothetical protein